MDTLGYSDADELSNYLIDYSSKNSRIKQPQFHLAISCKGNEFSPQELVEFAHRYLDEMGYGDPRQPLLIYEHHDTDNTHIHVITSRVNPSGKKIKDSHERRKSQKVIDKLLGNDMKVAADLDLKTALLFDFRSENQFKAVLESMNYECFEKDGQYLIKKGGMVLTSVSTEDVRKKMERNKLYHMNDPAENARLGAIFKKYRDTNSSRSELERDLKKMFGISLVCFGKKDSPYGYVAVDFCKKKVYEGSKIFPIKKLFDFKTPEEHLRDIEDYLENTLAQNPRITTKQINRKLGRYGAYVKKNLLIYGNRRQPLAETHAALLDRNNKIDWREGFNPQSESERDLLCKLTGYEFPSLIKVRENKGHYFCKDYQELSGIFSISDTRRRTEAFRAAGFRMIKDNDRYYAYRPETQTLVDLRESGFETSQYANIVNHENKNQHPVNLIENSKPAKSRHNEIGRNSRIAANDGSHYANREWEVGKKDTDLDDMDRKEGLSV